MSILAIRVSVELQKPACLLLFVATSSGLSTSHVKALLPLLGRSVADLFKPDEKAMVVPAGVGTMAFWDLLGKVEKKPVYVLLGA